MNKKIILNDAIIARLKRTSFQEIKKFILDACEKAEDSDDIDTMKMALVSISDKEPLQNESITLVHEAFKQHCAILDKKENSDIVALDAIQTAIYTLALKDILDCVHDYNSSDSLEVKDQIWRFQSEIRDFKDLLHIYVEGMRSGSVGPDEIENAITSLYLLLQFITDHVDKIKEDFFS